MSTDRTERVLKDVQIQLERRLLATGARGSLQVSTAGVVFETRQGTFSAPFSDWLGRWATLSPAEREAHVARLAAALRPAGRPSLAPRESSWSGLAAVLLLTAVVAAALVHGLRAAAQTKHLDAVSAERTLGKQERARKVCEAVQSRVMRGATVGPIDAEGWVVELRYLRVSGATALDPTETLQLVEAEFHQLEPADFSISEQPGEGSTETRIQFKQEAARSYFDEPSRMRWLRVAATIADSARASHGALFARCAHLDSHQFGAWFSGPTPGEAAATLLYFMGAFAESPQLRADLYLTAAERPLTSVDALRHLTEHTRALDKGEVSVWLSEDGGMIAGEHGKRSTISFPFKDANRAARASRRMARGLKLSLDLLNSPSKRPEP